MPHCMPTSDLARRPHAELGGVTRFLLVGLAVLAVGAGTGVLVYLGVGPLADPESCRAEVGGVVVELSIEQAENATTIAAAGVRRGLPARAVSIALATAFQESKIRNLGYGDRDSVGLFQQRPSQGWGTAEQIADPYYASNKFFDELVKIDGYQEMRITEAAQRVQRSGFPEAYEDHAEDARALASALTGYSPAQFTCVVEPSPDEASAETTGAGGLTPRAAEVRHALGRAFGELALGGFAPGGVSTGHMEGSAHYAGRAIDVFVRPVTEENNRRGWAIAHYLVAHADRLLIDHVIFDDRIWTTDSRSEDGWRDYDTPSSAGDPVVLEHRDHVHIDVLERQQ